MIPEALYGNKYLKERRVKIKNYMKKITYLFVFLLIVLSIGVSGVMAQPIQPSGKIIGTDEQGNVIYQVRANEINIGYKLIGSGEPLVMIMGLGGTMESWPQEVIETLSKKYQLIILDNRAWDIPQPMM